jgi:hypothetical protein
MARKGQGIGIVEGVQGSFGGEDFSANWWSVRCSRFSKLS